MGERNTRFRQAKGDRRKHNKIAEAPFLDSDGVMVHADRRMQPDRRVMNIAAGAGIVEHIEM